MCMNRLPKDMAQNKVVELTLGESPEEDWEAAIEFVKSRMAIDEDIMLPIWGADTESFSADMTWEKQGGSAWQGLMRHIRESKALGARTLSFSPAIPRKTAHSIPVRFFFGGQSWQVHIRLPCKLKRGTAGSPGKLEIELTTKLSPSVGTLFATLGTATGCGIHGDYVSWNDMIGALWESPCFQVIKPLL